MAISAWAAAARGDVLAFETKGSVASDDVQRRHFGQVRCDILADAVAEIFLFGVAAHVLEWQNANICLGVWLARF